MHINEVMIATGKLKSRQARSQMKKKYNADCADCNRKFYYFLSERIN